MSKAMNGGHKERRSDAKTESAKSASPKPDGTLAFSLTAGAIGIGVALLDQAKAAASANTGELASSGDQDGNASHLAGQITTEFSTNSANALFDVQNAPVLVAAVEAGRPMVDPVGVDLMTLVQKIQAFLQQTEALSEDASPPLASSVGEIAEAGGSEQHASLDTGTVTDATGDGPAVGGVISGGGHVASPSGPAVTDPLDQFQDLTENLNDLLGNGGPGSIPIVGSIVPGLLAPVGDILGEGGIIDDVLDGVGGLVDGLIGGGEDGSGLVGGVGGVVEGSLDAAGDLVGGLLGGGDDPGLVSGVGQAIDETLDTVSDVVGGALDTVEGLLGGLTDTVDDLGAGLSDTLDNVVGGIASTMTDTIDDVVGGAVTTVTGTLTGLLGGVVGSDDTGADSTDDLPSTATDTLESVLDTTTSTLTDTVEAATGPLGAVNEALDDVVGGAASAVTGTLDNVLGDLLGGGAEQPNIFEAAEGALQLSDGLISLLTPTISFIGQPIVEGNDHHDFANSNGSLLHGLI